MKKHAAIIWFVVIMFLCLAEAQGAGTNLPLINATGLLTLPTNGAVALTVGQINPQANGSFNVFGYGTVTNYTSTNWTVNLPALWVGKGVSNDAVAKLVYLNFKRAQPGTVITIR